MAGIGFELRKLLKKDTLLSLVRAYTYAGVISSGPWVLSIIGILITGLFSVSVVLPNIAVSQFQVTVTYLIAASLVFTGGLQLAFTRFCADRTFEDKPNVILPNFGGTICLLTTASGVLALLVAIFLFPMQSILYRVLLVGTFVTLCNIWIATVFLSGMKQYKAIVWLYLGGYAVAVGASLLLRSLNLEGLLLGFFIGQVVLLLGELILIIRSYPANYLIAFDVFDKRYLYPSLLLVGFFYNAGVWVDKWMFWMNAGTGSDVIGPLRASLIYDVPVFLSYLSLIPGMAVFLVRMETDFVEYYTKFYDAVRDGGSLSYMEDMRNNMVRVVRQGIYQILKIQIITVLLFIVLAEQFFTSLGISLLYIPLLKVQLAATTLQVVFLAIINVFCYLDKRRILVGLTLCFLVCNVAFTWVSLQLGPQFFGYGFLLALAVVVMLGLWQMHQRMQALEYETFMLH